MSPVPPVATIGVLLRIAVYLVTPLTTTNPSPNVTGATTGTMHFISACHNLSLIPPHTSHLLLPPPLLRLTLLAMVVATMAATTVIALAIVMGMDTTMVQAMGMETVVMAGAGAGGLRNLPISDLFS